MPDPEELQHPIQHPIQQPIQQQPIQQPEETITRQAFEQQWAQRGAEMDQLLNSRRNILFFQVQDSAEMAQVKQTLRTLNQALEVPLRLRTIGQQQIVQCYDFAIQACTRYVDAKRNARSGQGQARLLMVMQTLSKLRTEQKLFQTELAHITAAGQQLDEARSWQQVLHYAHAVHFDAGADEVRTLDYPCVPKLEVERGGKTVHFMPSEAFHPQLDELQRTKDYLGAHKDDAALQQAYTALRRNRGHQTFLVQIPSLLRNLHIEENFAQLTDAELTALVESIRGIPAMRNLLNDLDGSMDMFRQPQFTALCRMGLALNAQFVANSQADAAQIIEGSSLAMHTAAFSRMGTLLQTGELVADARVGILRTADGKTQTGAVLRNVEGPSLQELMRRADQPGAQPLVYSDQAILQLVNLQLLNLICGKVNHSPADCIAKTEEKNGRTVITGLTITHNEISFGDLRFADIERELPLNLRVIDDKMFHAIMSHTPETLTAMFRDLLSQRELDMLIERFTGVQVFLARRAQREDNDGNPLPNPLRLVSQIDPAVDWRTFFADQKDWSEQGQSTLVNPRYLAPEVRQAAQQAGGQP